MLPSGMHEYHTTRENASSGKVKNYEMRRE